MRVAIGLAFLATTVLLMAYATGMIPDLNQQKIASRLAHCETIAISASVQARQDETHRMETTLRAIAQRNEDIQSIAIRRTSGILIAEIGEHRSMWDNAMALRGSNTFVVVPITASNREPWGTIEVRFAELNRTGLARLTEDPCFLLFVAFPAAVFLLTFLYLKKMLRHMDPSKAVPSRVRSALDTLTGGLLVLDVKGRIVLANRSFSEATGHSRKELQGKPVADMPWVCSDQTFDASEYNWRQSIENSEPQKPIVLSLDEPDSRTFLVNCTAIEGEGGGYRGILASFDDVTQLKEKESELKQMLDELTESRENIRRHNAVLRELAMQDPLTGCMNRRAFFERFEQEWSRATRYGHPLSCLILDLDHFKSINDTYGHAAGDVVLKKAASLLIETVRDGDFVCRYGGEEFCIGMPHIDHADAVLAAERIRRELSTKVYIEDQAITASFGVSALSLGPEHPQALVEQADKAMYVAKRDGRDRVVCFTEVDDDVIVDNSKLQRLRDTSQENEIEIPFHAVTALTAALGYRDAATAEHSRRVADLCVAVGRRIMSSSDCYTLEIAALLHDIGKIGVPDAILLKPGPLTPKEWEIMGIHDHMGVEIVHSAFNSPALTEIIESHHAFYGGKSRHASLPTGKDIPLGARVLSVADTYDAIVSDRVYRKGRSPEEAFAELRRCAGTQFDPDIVEHFIDAMANEAQPQEGIFSQVNKRTALKIGTQIERLSQAIDEDDPENLQILLGRLKLTARECQAQEIADAVSELEDLVGETTETSELLALTNDLLHLCRSTQRAFLERQSEGRHDMDSIA
jgi:diguanylate cyclase (GGDEF)-like protein/PAS domain S-box-containing protein